MEWTITYCSSSITIPAHTHWTCWSPSFEGILESSSSLLPACEVAVDGHMSWENCWIGEWTTIYLELVIHYRSSWPHPVLPPCGLQVVPTPWSMKDCQPDPLNLWMQAGPVLMLLLLFCTFGLMLELFFATISHVRKWHGLRMHLPIPTHFFQLESYILSSRTSDRCDFPIHPVFKRPVFPVW